MNSLFIFIGLVLVIILVRELPKIIKLLAFLAAGYFLLRYFGVAGLSDLPLPLFFL